MRPLHRPLGFGLAAARAADVCEHGLLRLWTLDQRQKRSLNQRRPPPAGASLPRCTRHPFWLKHGLRRRAPGVSHGSGSSPNSSVPRRTQRPPAAHCQCPGARVMSSVLSLGDPRLTGRGSPARGCSGLSVETLRGIPVPWEHRASETQASAQEARFVAPTRLPGRRGGPVARAHPRTPEARVPGSPIMVLAVFQKCHQAGRCYGTKTSEKYSRSVSPPAQPL